MSREVDPLFKVHFDNEVKRSYGDRRMLAGTAYTKTNVKGESCRFQKKGKGMATRHNPGSDVTAMNVKYEPKSAILQDWEAFDFTDKFDGLKINFEEATEAAEVAADAIGLRMDQIMIDEMNKGYDAAGAGVQPDPLLPDFNGVVGTTNVALTLATLRDAKTLLDKKGVERTDRTFIHTAEMLDRDLLGTTEVTSTDFNTVQALVKGDLKTFLGFDFIMIADRDEGGLPYKNTTTDKMGFVYHKRAVGEAIGMNMETEMTWIPKMRAYMVGAEFSSGCVVIDTLGVVGVLAKA